MNVSLFFTTLVQNVFCSNKYVASYMQYIFLSFFVYGLFIDAVTSLDSLGWNDMMIDK
jgi:hypothetical protein